jgi:protein TonB
MCAIISKATARDVNERFQSCDEFIKGLKTDNFVVSNETVKVEVIIPTVLPINNAVSPNNIEEKQHLSEKEIALEKDKKKKKKLMLFLLAGIGFVTLCTIIITLTKENKEPLDAIIQNEAIINNAKENKEPLDAIIQNEAIINNAKENKEPLDKSKEVIETFVEEEAEFLGGYPAMMAWIQKNLVFPETAIEKGVQGKCFLRFVVSIDGSISSVTVTKGVPDCPECDKAAIKAIRSMPKLKPGKLNGRSVSSYCSIPINFAIE